MAPRTLNVLKPAHRKEGPRKKQVVKVRTGLFYIYARTFDITAIRTDTQTWRVTQKTLSGEIIRQENLDGRIPDKEMVEQLLKWKNRIGSEPRGETAASKVVGVRLTSSELERLKSVAREGESFGDTLRRLIAAA